MTEKQSKELLHKACNIIMSLEGWILEGSDYYDSITAQSVDNLFDEIDMLNEEDTGPEYDSAGFTEEDRIVNGQYMNMYKDTDPDLVQLERATPYENYVMQVKQNIDQAVEDGILKSGTECMSYSYMSEEGFNQRIKTDPEFAAYWADQEAQDWDTFGAKKI